jgi:hypothetical protein
MILLQQDQLTASELLEHRSKVTQGNKVSLVSEIEETCRDTEAA